MSSYSLDRRRTWSWRCPDMIFPFGTFLLNLGSVQLGQLTWLLERAVVISACRGGSRSEVSMREVGCIYLVDYQKNLLPFISLNWEFLLSLRSFSLVAPTTMQGPRIRQPFSNVVTLPSVVSLECPVLICRQWDKVSFIRWLLNKRIRSHILHGTDIISDIVIRHLSIIQTIAKPIYCVVPRRTIM